MTQYLHCFRNGYFYLFYSANNYDNPGYYAGVARSRSILGPYQRLKRRVLRTNPECYDRDSSCKFVGPGNSEPIKIDAKSH